MALAAFNFAVQDEAGNVINGASIQVRLESSGDLVDLFADSAGATPLGNPYTLADGAAGLFYIAGGVCRITATKGSFSKTWHHVSINTGESASLSFSIRAEAVAASIPLDVDSFRTNGYGAAGDGGGALYVRAGTEPTHDLKIQSFDGAWWEIAEPIIKPQMAGADPTGATDATAAINSALDYIRDKVYSPTILGRIHYLDGGGGLFKAAGSLNATGIALGRNWGIRNMLINAVCSNKTVLDLTGSRFGHFSDIHIWGDQTTPPYSGIQIAIENDGAGGSNPCSHNHFENCSIDGYFLYTSFHNFAAEQTICTHCIVWNRRASDGSGPSWAAILDGAREKLPKSDFTTFPAATRYSFTVNEYNHCMFQKPFGVAGPALFLQDIANFKFINCYTTTGTLHAIEWRLTSFAPYMIDMEFQVETTGNQTFINFFVDTVSAQRLIHRLSIRMGNVFSADQFFKISSSFNRITFTDFELKIPNWAASAPTNKVFDLPAKIAISNGNILVPALADMNLPSTMISFDGTISDVTGVSARYLKSYTVAGLPAAGSAGQYIYVSNGTTNKRFAVSDGTNWRFPDGAIVS